MLASWGLLRSLIAQRARAPKAVAPLNQVGQPLMTAAHPPWPSQAARQAAIRSGNFIDLAAEEDPSKVAAAQAAIHAEFKQVRVVINLCR